MYALISIFYVALLGMIVMLLLKRREMSSGKTAAMSKVGQRSEHFFHSIFVSIRHFVSYFNRRTAIALGQWIAYHVLLRVRNVYVEIKHRFIANPHGKKVIDAVRGRGEVSHHGASFYLRRISDK